MAPSILVLEMQWTSTTHVGDATLSKWHYITEWEVESDQQGEQHAVRLLSRTQLPISGWQNNSDTLIESVGIFFVMQRILTENKMPANGENQNE